MTIQPIMTLALALPLWFFHQSPAMAADPIILKKSVEYRVIIPST